MLKDLETFKQFSVKDLIYSSSPINLLMEYKCITNDVILFPLEYMVQTALYGMLHSRGWCHQWARSLIIEEKALFLKNHKSLNKE